jgi:hypothetical protein
MQRVLAWTILGAAIAVPVAADRADDDLQAVRKAVQVTPSPAPSPEKARPPVEAEPMPQQARPPLRSSDLKWLHVRVSPKSGGKSGRVSVNLPLGLVRAFGDDWPIPAPGCHRHDRCHLTLGELLRALDSGQTLVDIEDDEATVKVWVE